MKATEKKCKLRIQMDLAIAKKRVMCIKHFHDEDIIRFKIPITMTGPAVKVSLFQ